MNGFVLSAILEFLANRAKYKTKLLQVISRILVKRASLVYGPLHAQRLRPIRLARALPRDQRAQPPRCRLRGPNCRASPLLPEPRTPSVPPTSQSQAQREVERRGLPPALAHRVMAFFKFKHHGDNTQDGGAVTQELPPALRLQVGARKPQEAGAPPQAAGARRRKRVI